MLPAADQNPGTRKPSNCKSALPPPLVSLNLNLNLNLNRLNLTRLNLEQFAPQPQVSTSTATRTTTSAPASTHPTSPQTMSNQPYDPYIPGGSGNPPAGQKGNPKTQAIQAQIDDTVGIMRDNITKVAERGERLDTLQDKTDNLAVSAQGFRRGANRVRKQMWWKDMKMRLFIALGVIVLLLIIIIPIVVKSK
ncbi:hypothetical protein PCANC_28847 [Puccinia coronata f. sp. avenae]|uniref:V-SNARE coiled-coil homology domain-containing protein n=1 Tax=Puccinia coronata f. sp. avenae TaxID=200324 RepID=A0A2N5TAX0_9BASI|nr:hypothetical protein PCANC_28847 [Puccinia coronata f. sp. avenae]